MYCYQCGVLSTRYIHCPTCGAIVRGCAAHDPALHQCNVPMDGVVATSVSSSQPPVTFTNQPAGGTATLARGAGNQLKAPRNKFTFLSYNLQNFTGDQRMGRTNGGIQSYANQVRARFIAALMHATQAQGLMAMETGSDVSAAMEAVRRHAGDEFDPFVSERTHMTPTIKTEHQLAFTFQLRDVWHFRNLLAVFGVVPGQRRPIELDTAMAFMRDLRNFDFELPTTNPILWFEACARREAKDDGLSVLARGLLYWGAINSFAVLLELVEALRYLRRSAMRARNVTVFHASEQLELLHLIAFYGDQALDAGQMDVLKRCGPEDSAFEHQRNLPLSLFILLACKQVAITRHDDELIHDQADASMVYDALSYFGCVEFHFETYGVLFRRDTVNIAKLLENQGHFQVMRFDEEGKLLGTQLPGSTYNWRSALRMFVPLRGGKWFEALLFHTRFTVNKGDIVPTGNRRGQRRKKTGVPSAKEQTYAIRAGGVKEVARHITVVNGYGIPIVYCGDFNLPMTANSDTLAKFASDMETLGFTRYPPGLPATTLRAIPSLVDSEGSQESYSEAYDAVYAHGLPSQHIACTVLTLDVIFSLVDREVIALLMPAVVRYYHRQVAELRSRIASRFDRLPLIPGAGSDDWNQVVRRSALLQSVMQFDQFLDANVRLFDNGSIFHDCSILKPELTKAAADLKNALARAREFPSLGRLVYWLTELCEDFDDAARVIGTLECSQSTRFAVGYESWISDHLPLLTTLDLDVPVTAPPFSPLVSTSSGSPGGSSSGSWPPSAFVAHTLPVPANAEEFLLQQGAEGAVQRYRDFLAQHGLKEGSASSDNNICLLDTLGQHIYGIGDPQAADKVSQDVNVMPGPMLAIGDVPFPNYLALSGVMVRLWMLGRDGTVGPPIDIGGSSPPARIVHVLHYGAHYVPLWPR